MKKSYKILGVLWDRMDDCTTPITTVKPETIRTVFNYNVGPHLFDSIEYARTISLTELFAIERKTLLDNVIEKLRPCQTVYIILDFKPACDNKIVTAFYQKRLRQIYQFIDTKLTTAKIKFVN